MVVDVDSAPLTELLDKKWVQQIIASLGGGIDTSATDGLRYGKIIILVDDSLQGRAMEQAVISLLRRFMPSVIATGNVYRTQVDANATESEFYRSAMAPQTRTLEQLRG